MMMKGYKGLNILIFSPVKIYPADAGSRIRIFNMVNHLKNMGHYIHFLEYSPNNLDKNYVDYMQDKFDTFSVIIKKKKVKEKCGNYKIDEWYENSIHEKIIEMIDTLKIDTVLTNYIFHSKFLEYLPKHIYKIIDTHDRFTDRYKLFENKSDINYTWHSYSKTDEAKALQRADAVISITDEERDYFSSICDSKVFTIGHIETTKELDKSYTKLDKIGFIGGQNQVNIIAINEFLETFFTNSKYKNDITIVIAGRICKHIKLKNKNIKLLGLVKDTKTFYEDVDLVINPLMFGTGQKIKSIEALSYNIPIISTKVGFEGIKSDMDFHKAESIIEMVAKIDYIKENIVELQKLSEYCEKIFYEYIKDLNTKIDDVFISSKKTQSLDDKTLSEYRYNSQKEIYNIMINNYEKKLKKHISLMKNIRELTKISFFKNPIEKYKSYKNMLKVYYAKN
jgi:hypothetical protein